MTEYEIVELDKRLKFAKDKTVEFINVGDVQRQIEHSKTNGHYPELMAHIETSISRGEASFRKFQGIGLSLAILSSEKYIDSVQSMGIGVDYPRDLLIVAKRDFAAGAYDDASKMVTKIRDLIMNLHVERREELALRLNSLSPRIQDAENIGADLGNAKLALEDACLALENEKLLDCPSHMDRVETAIDDAWAQRTALIKETIDFVASLITDAEGIGGDTKEAREKLDYAKELFATEEFQECMHETIDSENMVTELIRRQAQRAQSLLKTLHERYTVASANPPLIEARVETSIERIDLVEPKKPCPACGKTLSFIEKYNRWYCYSCEQYA